MEKKMVFDKPATHNIMNATTPLFAQKGFAGVSVKELAEAANVNIALISYYFGGKENLYTAILETQFTVVDNIMALIREEEECPVKKIRRLFQEFVKIDKLYPSIHRLIYGEMINPTMCYGGIIKPGIIRLHDFVEECVIAGIKSGQIRPDVKPDCANLFLSSVLHFYFLNNQLADEFLQPSPDKAEYYLGEAIEMCLKGILTEVK